MSSACELACTRTEVVHATNQRSGHLQVTSSALGQDKCSACHLPWSSKWAVHIFCPGAGHARTYRLNCIMTHAHLFIFHAAHNKRQQLTCGYKGIMKEMVYWNLPCLVPGNVQESCNYLTFSDRWWKFDMTGIQDCQRKWYPEMCSVPHQEMYRKF